jgi:exoribonuclease R
MPILQIPIELAHSEFVKNPVGHKNTLFHARIKNWSAASNYPIGIVDGLIGMIGEIPVETSALLTDSGITWDEFPPNIEKCLPKMVISLFY